MRSQLERRRQGTILPVLAISITGMFGFLALAIDLGMLAIARTNCQNAADAGALSGARQLDNKNSNNNFTAANNMARAAVTSNSTMKTPFIDGTGGNISAVDIGVYNYNTSNSRFEVSFPSTLPTNTSWTAVKVSLTASQPTFFAKVLGVNSMPTGADAVAVHRPRDIAIVLDFSASMLFGSTVSWESGYGNSNGVNRGLLNPDPNYPKFGHYSRYTQYNSNFIPASGGEATAASNATPSNRPHPLFNTDNYVMNSGEVAGVGNHTVETNSGPPLVMDFRFSSSNIGTPSNTAAATNNMWNAFHRWFQSTPTDTPNTALAAADQGNVYKYSGFKPTINTTTTNTSYVSRTFDWSTYDSTDTTNTKGPTPAPDFFDTQATSSGVSYVGDQWPRQNGVALTTATSWLQANSNGAAVNAVDYLGWRTAYNLQAPNRGTTASGSGATLRNALSLTPATNNYNSGWTDFRDAAWERYGYDLDVADYVTNRPASWDPRWDWNIDTAAWQHLRATGTSPSTTSFRPKREATANLYKGFSMGPGYWGKTFFIWPPDPRTPVSTPGNTGYVAGDWRQRFFYQGNSTETATTGRLDPTALDNNAATTGNQNINQAIMFTGSGYTLLDAANGANRNYRVHYRNVLAWLKSGPQALPPNLRAGRILYYSSIPDNVDSASSNLDQAFWKGYIDFVLGQTADTNYDPEYNSAGVEYLAWPEGATITAGITAAYTHGITGVNPATDPVPYMNYSDNPNRPRVNFWFGPLSMIHFIYSRSPRRIFSAGTIREAQSWQLKAAMNSALEDIRINHPNDTCGMAYFANFNYSTPRVSAGQDWTKLKNSLFYPASLLSGTTPLINTVTNELRPYNNSMSPTLVGNLPNSNGGTDPNTGFAIAYNMLSRSTGLNTTHYPTLGRRGASKIVIFETDGVPNGTPGWSLTGTGLNTRYQNSGSTSLWASETRNGVTLNTGTLNNAALAALSIVKQIAALETTGSGTGGLSTTNSQARTYAIAFGDLFEGYNGTQASLSTQAAKDAITFLLRAQQLGGTSDWSTSATFPTMNVITGSYQTRITNLKDVLQRIMQSGVQVTLIQ